MPPAASEDRRRPIGDVIDQFAVDSRRDPFPPFAHRAVSTSMNYELFIGLRYLRARRRETYR
jgi:hypothetical protein